MMLIYQRHCDTCSLRFISEVLAGFAMRPGTDLLLTLGSHPLAIGHVAYITHRQCARLVLFGPVHYRARYLMLDIAGAHLLLGEETILPTLQTLPAARAFLPLGLLLLKLREAFRGVLARGPETTC